MDFVSETDYGSCICLRAFLLSHCFLFSGSQPWKPLKWLFGCWLHKTPGLYDWGPKFMSSETTGKKRRGCLGYRDNCLSPPPSLPFQVNPGRWLDPIGSMIRLVSFYLSFCLSIPLIFSFSFWQNKKVKSLSLYLSNLSLKGINSLICIFRGFLSILLCTSYGYKNE